MRPHRRQPTRLLCPWDSPGKNTGVGCHFLLQCMKVKSQSPLQAAIGKLSLALTSTLSPCKVQQRQTLALRLRAVSAQAGLTRTAASRCSRPASDWASPPGTPAASCRPVRWGQPRASRRCEARLQAPLMVAVGELHGGGRRTPGALVPTLATNAIGGHGLSPDPNTEGGEGGAGWSGNAPQLW